MKLEQVLTKENFDLEDIVYLLSLEDAEEQNRLFKAAYAVKEKYIGRKVYYRGLIEYSNICKKNCYYCGIRGENINTERYTMTDEEVLEAAQAAYDYGYASVVIQSGEREDQQFIDKINYFLREIKKIGDGSLGVTLSVGEQSEKVYDDFFVNGAHRYLLRIESSNPALYAKIHPADHSFERRVECLKALKRTGYQVGTGVMIGLPGQMLEDLARDILFFKELDIDMIGMGPYIEHEDTPLYESRAELSSKMDRFNLALRMIAVTRLVLKDVNIAAATALQAIVPNGREKGLLAGANIIMPNLTPVKYRESYLLYEDKPCLDEDADKCRGCLETRITAIGETIGYREWGDSKHFETRNK